MIKINAPDRLRDMSVFRVKSATIDHVAISPEVQHTLTTWIKSNNTNPGVLIGGLAMSFYCKPRYTQDADVLYLQLSDVPKEVDGFKAHRKLAFEERKTRAEVEIVTPESVGLPYRIAKRVIEDAVDRGGIKVASLDSMLVLKLFGSLTAKRHRKDLADIVSMLSECKQIPNLSSWNLPENLQQLYTILVSEALE
jgi:hypothetical protein